MKRSYVLLAAVLAVAVLATSAILGACSGGGGGGAAQQPAPKVQLSGTIGTGYTKTAKPSTLLFEKFLATIGFASSVNAASGADVNKVIAIPIYSGSLSARNMPGQTASIDVATGKFNLSLTKDSDWLLLLLNTQETGTKRFVGSVAFDAGSSNSMLSFPATATALTSMSLGTVSYDSIKNTDDAITSKVVGTADYSLSASDITAMAKTDKYFRNAMNIVNNYEMYGNGAGKYYQLRPDFHWNGDVTSLVSGASLSSAPTLTFNGLNFQLDQNMHLPTDSAFMNSVCSTTGFVSFHPPKSAPTVTINSVGYNYDNPIKNAGKGCNPVSTPTGTRYITSTYDGIYASNQYDYISFSVIPSFVSVASATWAGHWEWREDNGATLRGAFDIANINPPITADGKVQGFVPVYKINKDVTNKITSVDITWYYWNGTNHVPVPSTEVLKHFVGSVEAKFDVTFPSGPAGQRRTCEMYVDISNMSPTGVTRLYPTDPAYAQSCQGDPAHKDWYHNDAPGTHDETNIVPGSNSSSFIGFYESGGFGYFFEYR